MRCCSILLVVVGWLTLWGGWPASAAARQAVTNYPLSLYTNPPVVEAGIYRATGQPQGMIQQDVPVTVVETRKIAYHGSEVMWYAIRPQDSAMIFWIYGGDHTMPTLTFRDQ